VLKELAQKARERKQIRGGKRPPREGNRPYRSMEKAKQKMGAKVGRKGRTIPRFPKQKVKKEFYSCLCTSGRGLEPGVKGNFHEILVGAEESKSRMPLQPDDFTRKVRACAINSTGGLASGGGEVTGEVRVKRGQTVPSCLTLRVNI